MSEKAKERKSSVRIIATGLFILAGILLVLAITGYSGTRLYFMRPQKALWRRSPRKRGRIS